MGDYEIHCDIEVCMNSVDGSSCDIVSENCGFQDWDDPLDPFEDLECQPGEDVTDRPEIYADFEAEICGPLLLFMNCRITNVICVGDGTFQFDFDLTPIFAATRSSSLACEKILENSDLETRYPMF